MDVSMKRPTVSSLAAVLKSGGSLPGTGGALVCISTGSYASLPHFTAERRYEVVSETAAYYHVVSDDKELLRVSKKTLCVTRGMGPRYYCCGMAPARAPSFSLAASEPSSPTS
jgi:hypothetical protein